jgi:hypothetical protein
LPKQVLNSLLLAHGGHIFRKVQELKARDYASDAKIWETMKTHIYQIVDAIAGALAKQLPNAFSEILLSERKMLVPPAIGIASSPGASGALEVGYRSVALRLGRCSLFVDDRSQPGQRGT